MRLRSSPPPPIFLNTDHKTHHPLSFRISENSRAPNKSQTRARAAKKKEIVVEIEQELKPLWDDGYGTQTARDYIEAAKAMIKCDDGGPPINNSPLLLYLPGIDGVGMGMVLHHKAIGKVFRLRCMHVPVHDRTPYEELVSFDGEAAEAEHASSPNNPIYMVGRLPRSFCSCCVSCNWI